jgi:Domain of unknown function (DUF5665)
MEKSVKEQAQIKKMPTAKQKVIASLDSAQIDRLEWLIDAIQSMWLDEFIEYIRSPWKMLWPNFVAGIARGFGALVGATIVIGIIGWTLSTIIDLPLIGKWIEPSVEKVQHEFNKYTEATNYKESFTDLGSKLDAIRVELERDNVLMNLSGSVIR